MKRFVPLLFVYFLVLVFFFPVFSVYFSHDDFFHFKASLTDGTIGGFVKLFGFPSFDERGYAFYRPLFREGLYNIYYNLFGLNHIPFRIFAFIIHLVNIFLVYTLIEKIFKKQEISFFSALFFGVTAANVGSLYYLAGGIQTLGATMFILLTLILFLKDKVLLSIFTFILALSSHELSASIPFLLVGLLWLNHPLKDLPRIVTKNLWPFFLILAVYLYIDIFQIGFLQKEVQYEPTFSIKKILNSFAWYFVWSLGIPEMFLDFIGPGVSVNPNLMKFWSAYVIPIFVLSFLIILAIAFCLLLNSRNLFREKKILFFMLWFPLVISPVLLLPLHKSTYYLSPALPAVSTVLAFILINSYQFLSKRKGLILLFVFTSSFIVLSYYSIGLANVTYPAANRGRIAQRLLEDVKEKYPDLSSGSIVYFKNDLLYPFISAEWGGSSKQAAIALNNEDAIQLLYKDFTLRVFFEDMGGIPTELEQSQIYSLTARIN